MDTVKLFASGGFKLGDDRPAPSADRRTAAARNQTQLSGSTPEAPEDSRTALLDAPVQGLENKERNNEDDENARQQEMAKAAREIALHFNVKVELEVEETTGRQVARIYSRDGERFIRQMPPQAALELAHKVAEGLAEGLLTNKV